MTQYEQLMAADRPQVPPMSSVRCQKE